MVSNYNGPIVDVDVHHTWRSDSDIVDRLPQLWREYARATGQPLQPPSYNLSPFTGTNKRLDSVPRSGGSPGSDYDTLREQLLDRFNVAACVLTFDAGGEANHRNPYFSVAMARAINDWNVDTWLSLADDRLRSVVLLPPGLPEEAAKEIRRVGKHPRIISALMGGNPRSIPLGDPFYHPIYEAAVEMDLSVSIHVVGTGERVEAQVAGGIPGSRMELLNSLPNSGIHYISSLIVHGVFEKFPTLRVLIVEFGVAWLPWLMWRLDSYYAVLKAESHWVKKLPSDYIREHMHLSTQPLETSPRPHQLIDVLSSVAGVENLLCFSTDYPHWDIDDPHFVSRLLPKDWLPGVFYENARDAYGPRLGLPPLAPRPAIASRGRV